MGESVDMPVPAAEGARPAHLAKLATLKNPRFVAFLFGGTIALQAVGYLILGTGRPGRDFSATILCFQNFLAVACGIIAFRRAWGASAVFWFLFIVDLLFLMVPTVLMTVSTLFNVTLVASSTWRVLFCLYGAPIAMMIFLPENDQRGRQRSQIFLDQFQVAIVVGLGYTTFFYLPLQRMVTWDALVRNLTISNLLSLFLLVAVFVRLQFARTRRSRNILQRLGTFVLSCAAVTLVGNWVDLHNYVSASAWFDIGWALPYVVAGLGALTWSPEPEAQSAAEPTNFLSFVGRNLVLVAVLFCMNLMLEDWKRAHGAMLTDVAVAALLLAFTFRLAITQHAQQQEIVQRKAAQEQLSAANETIGGLLEEARVETSAVTQVSEIGALMQGCTSREEAFHLIPERMARLFPGTSGTLSVLNSTRTRAVVVAGWGHIRSDGASLSISIPLIAHEEALGVLVVQDDCQISAEARPLYASEAARRRQLAFTVAEHIALTVSNLDLREALHLQATRDSLTGLYNRRYMEESLDREFHRARRRERPLSVMMLDIDHFKRYNDNFGHAAGDDALRLVGETLLASVRAEDLACRYGGEEFLLILPECPLAQAGVRAEQIRARLKELYLERAGELPDVVTVSIGVAAFQETTDSIDLLIKFADDALYQAKHDGRDRVAMARPAQPHAVDPDPTIHPDGIANVKVT